MMKVFVVYDLRVSNLELCVVCDSRSHSDTPEKASGG